MKSGVWVQNARPSTFDVVSIWSEQKPHPPHLLTFRPVDSSLRSTSGYYQQSWDVSYKSFRKRSPELCANTCTEWLSHFHGDISCSWIFIYFKVNGPPLKGLDFLNRISQNLECHTRVLSAYLAAKQSHGVKECILLLQSSLKRIGKQVPARPLTLLPCGGVRLRRRCSRIKLLRVGSLAADMRHCTLLDSLAECSICMEMSHNHHNMCPSSCIL